MRLRFNKILKIYFNKFYNVCDKMKEILKSLAEGKISIEECDTLLKAESIRQLDDVAQIDTSRMKII